MPISGRSPRAVARHSTAPSSTTVSSLSRKSSSPDAFEAARLVARAKLSSSPVGTRRPRGCRSTTFAESVAAAGITTTTSRIRSLASESRQ
jgi:hypothetical protein